MLRGGMGGASLSALALAEALACEVPSVIVDRRAALGVEILLLAGVLKAPSGGDIDEFGDMVVASTSRRRRAVTETQCFPDGRAGCC